jgi:hypothetical protein
VVLPDRKRQQTLIAGLLRVEEEILGVEASTANTINNSPSQLLCQLTG